VEALERRNSRSDIKYLKQQGDADMFAQLFDGRSEALCVQWFNG
jgi:hypothetical protein